MKTAFFLLCLVAMFGTTLAQRKNETENPIIGTWKFSRQSINNDFQKKFEGMRNFPNEYLTFYQNHTFRHEFMDTKGNVGKELTGEWKLKNDAISILYDEIDFNLKTNYFFIDTDLVLGQNFNHVVFTKQSINEPIVMK